MVIADCAGALKEAERDVFGPDELPVDIRESLNTTLRLFLPRATPPGPHSSGVVIAGMGAIEHFPRLLHCWVGPIVKGRLKLHIFDHAQVARRRSHDYPPSHVTPNAATTGCPSDISIGDAGDISIGDLHSVLSTPQVLMPSAEAHRNQKSHCERITTL